MSEEDVHKILSAFPETAKTLTIADMVAFNHFRNLLINNSDLLDLYEQFFSSFYNVGLFFVEYCSWHNQGQQMSARQFPLRFDGFLTMCWKREGGFWNTLWNGRLPDDSVYDMSISENYPAYKIINMQAAPALFLGSTVSFANYDDLEDKNIEELLFENIKFQNIILTIKELYLNNKALNFGAFRNLEIDNKFWERLMDVSKALTRPSVSINVI